MTNSAYDRLYPENQYGGYPARDGAVAFYCRVQALLQPHFVVCDFGCGRGFHKDLYRGFTRELQVLKGRAAHVVGVDIDAYGSDNPYIDEFRHITAEDGRLPMADGSVDLVVTEWVVEHLPDPQRTFAELARIVKPGGYVCCRTPNLWHYSCLGALLIPDRHHYAVRRFLCQPHEAGDVFPTLYRCNTVRRLRSTLERQGFKVHVQRHKGPSHLAEAGPLWGRLGEFVEMLSPRFLWHELHAFGRRQ